MSKFPSLSLNFLISKNMLAQVSEMFVKLLHANAEKAQT